MTREEAIKYGIEWLKDEYLDAKDGAFIKIALESLEQEPCEDTISRQAVKEQMIKYGFHAPDMTVTEFVEDLLPVTPQRKTAYWIKRPNDFRCSKCLIVHSHTSIFCPSCGARMVDPQERSEQE